MSTENQITTNTPAEVGLVSTALLGSSIIRCGECLAPATWHADHCDAGRVYYCGQCVAIPNRDGELSQLRRMPPGRDNIPANHPRRIAAIYHLPQHTLRHESPEVQRLCAEAKFEAMLREGEARKVEREKVSADIDAKVRANMEAMNLYTTDEEGRETPVGVFHAEQPLRNP